MNVRAICLLLLGLPLTRLVAADPSPAAGEFPASAYTEIGSSLAVSSGITKLGWTDAQFEAFVAGLRAATRGQPVPLSAAGRSLHEAIGRRLQELQEAPAPTMPSGQFTSAAAIEKYMQDMVRDMKMQRLDSGLAYLLLSSGVGSRPGPEDTVVISLSATGADAHTDYPGLSADHRRVKVADLLPGLAEGVQMLVVGGQGMFVLPPDLAFGQGEWPTGVERGAPIIFTVTLHEVLTVP